MKMGTNEERAERRMAHIAELRKRASEAEAKLKRLYDAIENGVADLSDPMLKNRIAAATISAHSPNASKWTRKKFASWDRKACSCARSLPLQARNGGFLAAQFFSEVGRPEGFPTLNPRIFVRVAIPLEYGGFFAPTRNKTAMGPGQAAHL